MIQPDSEAALAEAIQSTSDPVHVIGGGTRPIGRPVAGVDLTASGLTGITLYEPGALTLVARAGTPLGDIEDAVAAENQMLAFEPMDHRMLLGTEGTPTIGGVVSGNVSGPRRVATVGACRDALLGVRFVDGQGQIIKNGGRVMKNVTGYDLVKLMAGSHGTLGVLSEVSLKVLPRPEATTTLVLEGLTGTRALAAMQQAMNSPYEVTGAATVGNTTYLRLEGFEASVAYRMQKLRELLSAYGSGTLHDGAGPWPDVRDVKALAHCSHVWRIVMAPTDFETAIRPILEGAQVDMLVDRAGGLVWAGTTDGDPYHLHQQLQAAVRNPDTTVYGGGHVTLVKAPEDMRAQVPCFQPENPVVTRLSEGLRQKFDPNGILNPGLMT